MNIREWKLDDDYDTLVKWWNEWDFGVVPKECLPPAGIMVEDENGPICAGGLYIGEGTQFGFMEWIVSDKNANIRQVHKALGLCINSIMNMAQEKGMRLVYAVTGEEALHKRFTKYHGMELTENHAKTFLKDIYNGYDDLEWISDAEQHAKRMEQK